MIINYTNKMRDQLKPTLQRLKVNYPEIFKIHSHTNQWEKALIYSLCEKLPTGSVIFEIGAHLGATSCIMGLVASKKNRHANCIDTWDNRNFPGESPINTYGEWKNNTKKFSLFLTPYIGTSLYWAERFSKRQVFNGISLIFFDADHSYEGITGDINAWLPLCMPGCCLVFHDYGGKDGRPAIRQAVEELVFPIQNGPGYTFESIYYCWKK